MTIFHDPRCVEYSIAGHPEQPARITDSAAVLKDRHLEWVWRESFAADEIALLRAHSPEHLARIRNALNDFDADTPAHRDINQDRKSTRLNSSYRTISYAVFCLKKIKYK